MFEFKLLFFIIITIAYILKYLLFIVYNAWTEMLVHFNSEKCIDFTSEIIRNKAKLTAQLTFITK